jgi:hypothetical protein
MEDNSKLIEALLARATEYGKTSFQLIKLKALAKISDLLSAFITHSIVVCLVVCFLLFLNLGLALWLGDILGKVYYGFFAVAAMYGVIALVIHFFLHERVKKLVCNYIIQQALH